MACAGRGERECERVTDRVVKIDLVLAHGGQRFGLGFDFAQRCRQGRAARFDKGGANAATHAGSWLRFTCASREKRARRWVLGRPKATFMPSRV
jgi:hypothetical protein